MSNMIQDHSIGTGQIKVLVFKRNKDSEFYNDRPKGWYYFYYVEMGDTGEMLSGQIKGPFDTDTLALVTAKEGY